MTFRIQSAKGINYIRKNLQQHHIPLFVLDKHKRYWKKKNCIYGLNWSVDRELSIDFMKKLSYIIDKSSLINIMCDDPFVELNLKYMLKDKDNIIINGEEYDIPAGNPEFYRRSKKTADSRPGNALVYNKHIQNAVARKSGRFKHNGPFITDLSWFQGEGSQGTFRTWLFDDFGLKNIIILDNKEFDVGNEKGLCMFYGEDGYTGDITLENLITKEKFTKDFRSIGYIITDPILADLLPSISTPSRYKWERTNNELNDIPEVKGGKVKVLKSMYLDQEPDYYYTSEEYINDWSDIDEERVATRYQPATGHNRFYEIAVGTVVPAGVVIPGYLKFTYTKVKKNTGQKHLSHLMSQEVTNILKKTRTGKSLHTPQTIWIPYATEFKGFTNSDKKIINNL